MAVPYNQRTYYCGQLRKEHIGQTVILDGWVNSWRDHGGMVFIDLRDRGGAGAAEVRPPDRPGGPQDRQVAAQRKRGRDSRHVAARPADMVNPKLATGESKSSSARSMCCSKAETPPFEVADDVSVGEDTRLRYRYVDLRRPVMQHCLMTRHRMIRLMREYFDELGFVESRRPC